MDVIARNRNLITLVSAIAILFFSAFTLFYKLGTMPFEDYDEATYAQVTHESMAHGNPSSPTFLNQPYFRKPPLLFWMTTASERVFTDVEFADRFPSALAGFLAIILVSLVCIEAGTGTVFALFAAGVLATTAAWMEFARDVRFDNLVAFCSIAAFYAAVRALRDSRWFRMVGIMLALAILAKSVMAVFGGIAVVVLLVRGRGVRDLLKDKELWFGVGLLFLVAVPWHLYMTLTYGAAFWHSYLGTEVLARASTNLFPSAHSPTNSDYISYVLSNAAPWFQAFLATLIAAPLLIRRLSGTMRSVFIASLITGLAVLVVTLTAKTKAFGYLMPLFPFMAVALGIACRLVWKQLSSRPILIGCAVFFIAYAVALAPYEALHADPYYSNEIRQAYEEHDIAALIHASSNPEVYAYGNYSDFGTILYYSRLPDSKNPYILFWSASSTPSATSTIFILASTTLPSLNASFPHYHFTETYTGSFVSLFTITD